MPSPALALVDTHRLAQVRNASSAAALTDRLVNLYWSGQINRDEFFASLVAVDKIGWSTSNNLAVAYIKEYRAIQDPLSRHEPPVTVGYNSGMTVGRASWFVKETERLAAKRDLLEPAIFTEAFRKLANRLIDKTYADAMSAFRSAVRISADYNGKTYRRVTGPNPCAFCAMLSTKEDYVSAEAAGFVVGKFHTVAGGTRVYNGRLAGARKRRIGEKFHDHCGCSVVENVGDGLPMTPQLQRSLDAYEAAAAQCRKEGKPITQKNVLPIMRKHEGFSDSAKPAA